MKNRSLFHSLFPIFTPVSSSLMSASVAGVGVRGFTLYASILFLLLHPCAHLVLSFFFLGVVAFRPAMAGLGIFIINTK